LVTDENTYSLAEASGVYGQEVGLLAEIIEDYANRVLPVKISNEEELEQYQDDENGFEKIQTTKGLIRYLKARIEGQKTRLDKANTKLNNSYNDIISEMNTKFPILKEKIISGANTIVGYQSFVNESSNELKEKAIELGIEIPEEFKDLLENNNSFSIKGGPDYNQISEGFFQGELEQPLGRAVMADSLLKQMNGNLALANTMSGNVQRSTESLKVEKGALQGQLKLEKDPIKKVDITNKIDNINKNISKNDVELKRLNGIGKENKDGIKKVSDSRQQVDDAKREKERITNKAKYTCESLECLVDKLPANIKNGMIRTNEIRKKYDIGGSKTVGFADVFDKDGNKIKSYIAHSGEKSSKNGTVKSNLELGAKSTYNPDKKFETEAKLMEQIARDFPNEKVKVELFTDRITCSSCSKFMNNIKWSNPNNPTPNLEVKYESGPIDGVGVKIPKF
jgi:hypothetical protein